MADDRTESRSRSMDGSLEHRSLEHRSLEHRSLEHRSLEHGSLEHGSLEHGSLEHGSLEHGSLEHGSLERVAAAADEVADEQRHVARQARSMQHRRERGAPWSRILDEEASPTLLQRLRH